ncbi:MAG: amidohydrolase family protein [Nanoarchaeota archaeon]
MKLIDIHGHIYNEQVEGAKYIGFDDLIKNLNKSGVDKIGIIQSILFDSDFSLKEIVGFAERDKRIFVISAIDVKKEIGKQLKEMEKYVRNGVVKGIKIYTGYQKVYAEDVQLEKVYDFCISHDIPIMFHTGDTLVDDAEVKYSHPLQFDSLAVRYPQLKIILAHMGNPWMEDCAEVVYKNKNVYVDISGFFTNVENKRYSELMKRKVNDFISYIQSCKILFGTDFPIVDILEYKKFVESLDLTDREKELVFFKNAKELFKL